MADKVLKSITFPGLPDKYIIPETQIDSVPTQGSNNTVSSGGVYSALESARDMAQQYAESINPENIFSAYPTDTASGSVVSFADGADDIPLKSLVVDINPVQDLSSGDPSPENICPISGWTEINAYNDPLHGGNIEWNQLVNSYRSVSTNGLTFVPDANNKSISISGTITTAFPYGTIAFTRDSPVKIKRDGRRYIIICNQATPYPIRIAGFADCVSVGSYGGVFSNYISGNQEFANTLAFYAIEGDTFAISNFTVQIFDLTTMFGTEIADYIYSLEQANVGAGVAWFKKLFPKDYYEYNAGEKTTVSAVNGKPYTHVNIQLGQTVYGGTLDVPTGVLTVDRAMVDLGTLSWNKKVSGVFYAWDLRNLAKAVSVSQTANARCSSLKLGPYVDVYDNATLDYTISVGSRSQIGVQCSAYAEAADFKSAMNGVQFCYELATPITYTLTPTEIKSLLGENNVWADAGDTEVIYRADPNLYIDKRIGTEAPMIATDNIVSGSYFMVGNNLYKATANIASGAAVVVGTNATAKTMAEALNEINA